MNSLSTAGNSAIEHARAAGIVALALAAATTFVAGNVAVAWYSVASLL